MRCFNSVQFSVQVVTKFLVATVIYRLPASRRSRTLVRNVMNFEDSMWGVKDGVDG